MRSGLLLHAATAQSLIDADAPAISPAHLQGLAHKRFAGQLATSQFETLEPSGLSEQSLAVMRSANVATINPALLRFQNPRFRLPVFVVQGQPRTELNLPTLVSPTATPDATTLFEDPQDASHKFFLTDYAIAGTANAGAPGKWVTFEPAGSGFLLTVHLADVTAAAKLQGNGRLSADTRYLLTATLQSRVISWDLAVGPADTDGGLVLTLPVTDFAARDLLYAAMTDPTAGAQLIIRRSLSLALPMAADATRYSTANQAIDSVISFTFSKELDAAVFGRLQGAGTPLAPWKVLGVNWNGRRHTYYQSSAQPDQVYFLPDAFKVGRQAQPPHLPDLAVSAQGDDAASMEMTLSYMAAPVWDPKRIEAALPQLQHTLGLAQPPGLALFEASNTTLMLSLPGEAGSAGAALVAQTNALIDLAAGVQGSVTLRLAAFRQVYDALFDTRGSLLSGEVRVVVGSDTTSLPFIARMGDLAGDIFDTKVDVDATTLTVTLTNAIESPIRVAGLTGVIARNGKPIDGTSVTGLAPRPPVELAPAGGPTGQDATIPAGSLTVTLAGSAARAVISSLGGLFGGMLAHSGLGGVLGQDGASSESSALGDLANLVIDPSCVPLFDFSQVSVKPDPVATWRAIMANGTPGPISRPVNLKFLAATLTPPGAAPAHDAVLAIQVVFQTGQTASFDASQAPDAGGFMNQALKISVPMEAFVLGDGPTDGYTYRVDAITPGGVRKGDWVTDNRDTIYIVPG